jgi:isopropylmalate/homocitrate/citramalate synthase
MDGQVIFFNPKIHSNRRHLIKSTPGADKVTWSCHCHNDLGLATANTLAGVANGARQVEVTINGIGERAGNTSMEEIVMVLYTHPDTYPVYSNIDPKCIYPTSQLVTRLTGKNNNVKEIRLWVISIIGKRRAMSQY